ncbi:MAG TPA: SURF1 family protein [Zeimonas sp.]
MSAARRGLRAWLPTLAALVVVAVTVSLGNWQLRRADEKRALQAQRDAAERDSPIEVAAGDVDAALEGRRVRVRGRFVSKFDVFIDNRTYRGVAGFHVLSPLRIAGSDSHVLVLRGWVASDPRERWRVPRVSSPDGEVEVEGIALHELAHTLELGTTPEPGPDDRIWLNVDLDRYRRWSGLKVQLPIVRALDAPRTASGPFDDGLVRDWPRPGGDVEKHVAYAFQWYAMATLAAGLWIWFVVLARWRGRRDEGNAN